MQRLGHLELREVAGALGREQATVAEHADGLHGVERDPVGGRSEPLPHVGRQPRDEPDEELVHLRRR